MREPMSLQILQWTMGTRERIVPLAQRVKPWRNEWKEDEVTIQRRGTSFIEILS